MNTSQTASFSSLPELPRKPMARVTRVTLFEREVKEQLSTAAIDILLGAAEILSEGRIAPANPAVGGKAGRCAFFGSTMLTILLSRLDASVRERCDEEAARRTARLIVSDARIGQRVRAIAEREACRVSGRRLPSVVSEVRVRAEGTRVFVDVDVEAELGPSLIVLGGGA